MENQVFVIIPPRSDSLFGQGCAQGYTDVKLWNARSQENRIYIAVELLLL